MQVETGIEQLYKNTCIFNEVAGNLLKTSLKDFQDQQNVLQEEISEIQEGINNQNLQEIVDGVIDSFVVLFGHWKRLELMGINMSEAGCRIAENNLSKYVNSEDYARINSTILMYKDKGTPVYTVVDKDHNLVCFKRSDTNKIVKPYGFQSVDIKDCIPTGAKMSWK